MSTYIRKTATHRILAFAAAFGLAAPAMSQSGTPTLPEMLNTIQDDDEFRQFQEDFAIYRVTYDAFAALQQELVELQATAAPVAVPAEAPVIPVIDWAELGTTEAELDQAFSEQTTRVIELVARQASEAIAVPDHDTELEEAKERLQALGQAQAIVGAGLNTSSPPATEIDPGLAAQIAELETLVAAAHDPAQLAALQLQGRTFIGNDSGYDAYIRTLYCPPAAGTAGSCPTAGSSPLGDLDEMATLALTDTLDGRERWRGDMEAFLAAMDPADPTTMELGNGAEDRVRTNDYLVVDLGMFDLAETTVEPGAMITLDAVTTIRSRQDDRAWVTIMPAGGDFNSDAFGWTFAGEGEESINHPAMRDGAPLDPGEYELILHSHWVNSGDINPIAMFPFTVVAPTPGAATP